MRILEHVGHRRLSGHSRLFLSLSGLVMLSLLFSESQLPAASKSEEREHVDRDRLTFDRPSGPRHTPDHMAPSREEPDRMQEMRLLHRFLSLPPERLQHLRETIERIENMSTEEKDELRSKIQEFHRLNATQRRRLEQTWKEMPSESRQKLHHHWQGMSPTERRRERRKLGQMNREERWQYHRRLLGQLRSPQEREPGAPASASQIEEPQSPEAIPVAPDPVSPE